MRISPTKDLRQIKNKCPKCHSSNITLVEIWKGATIAWIPTEPGIIDRNDGIINACDGSPFKVNATCSNCDHTWTIRGASQIDDCLI